MSLAKAARIVAHQIDGIEERANTNMILSLDDVEALDSMTKLALAMKRAKPEGVPIHVLRRVGLMPEQFEEIASLMEAEAAKG